MKCKTYQEVINVVSTQGWEFPHHDIAHGTQGTEGAKDETREAEPE